MSILKKLLIVTIFILMNVGLVNAETLTIGVHPYLGSDEITQRFTPFVNYLEKKLGYAVHLKVGMNYEQHIEAIGNDKIDIAILGPASYIKVEKKFGKKPLLARLEKNGSALMYGQIIVSSKSNLHSIKDLKNKKFAFGDPYSTLSTLVPKILLKQSGISDSELKYSKHYNGHINVAYSVLVGEMDAGAVKQSIFEKFKNKGLDSLIETPKISEHPFVARSNLNPELVNQLRIILKTTHTNSEGLKALKSINKNLTALVDVKDSDFDTLRKFLKQ